MSSAPAASTAEVDGAALGAGGSVGAVVDGVDVVGAILDAGGSDPVDVTVVDDAVVGDAVVFNDAADSDVDPQAAIAKERRINATCPPRPCTSAYCPR
jgi:hypothetical protein